MEETKNVAEFQIQDLMAIGITLGVTGIALAYTLNVMGDVRDDMTADTAERNATVDAIAGVAKLPEKLPLIVTVIVAAVINQPSCIATAC